jgi:hypothetical protein
MDHQKTTRDRGGGGSGHPSCSQLLLILADHLTCSSSLLHLLLVHLTNFSRFLQVLLVHQPSFFNILLLFLLIFFLFLQVLGYFRQGQNGIHKLFYQWLLVKIQVLLQSHVIHILPFLKHSTFRSNHFLGFLQ